MMQKVQVSALHTCLHYNPGFFFGEGLSFVVVVEPSNLAWQLIHTSLAACLPTAPLKLLITESGIKTFLTHLKMTPPLTEQCTLVGSSLSYTIVCIL